LKPDIVFFGERLPPAAWEQACSLASGSDLMLVLGTALTVFPAASIPSLTEKRGGRLAVVNREPTFLDDRAAFRFDDLAFVFGEFEKLLDAEASSHGGP
jgi:NAD-dependent deacetylase